MADTLCGPSNALQNFQKHAAVDRSLQQDRIAFRQSPSQSFRSLPASGASHVDAEFHAFQAGQPLLREQPFHARQMTPLVQAPSILPNWAADFQQLRLNDKASFQSSPRVGPVTGWQNEFLQQRAQNDFLQQAAAAPHAETRFGQSAWQPQMPTFSPLASSGMYGLSQQNQQPQLAIQEPVFDDAAFARAFEDLDNQIDESQDKGKAVDREPIVKFDLSHASMEMGDVTGEYDYNGTTPWVPQLESTRREVGWEALDAFQRAHDLEFQQTGNQQSREISSTIEKMRSEEHSPQAQTPENLETAEPIRIGADAIPATQQQAEPPDTDGEAEELARTAGQLIDNLRDETSAKFQQSSFMELMRQLRDKEVRVEGDTMVSVSVPGVVETTGLVLVAAAPDGEPMELAAAPARYMKQAPHPGGRYYPSDAFQDGASEARVDD